MGTPETSSLYVYNIPLALNPATFHTSGFDTAFGKSRVRQHVQDCKEHILGPIPPTAFIERFLPCPSDKAHVAASGRAFSGVPGRGKSSSAIYEPLVTALNYRTKLKSRCPGFVFDAPSSSGRANPHGIKVPHVCCYAVDNLALVKATDGVELGYAELFFQVSPDPHRDFFADPPSDGATRHSDYDFLACPEDPELHEKLHDALGQHIARTVEMFARQHRVCAFTMSMFGSRARFLRWDRAGCVVSESFDIRTQPDLLCDMLAGFAAASRYGRGHDPTVEMALAEEDIFLDAIKRHVRSQVGPGEDVDQVVRLHHQAGHVVAVKVLHHRFTATSENSRRFLISRPVVPPLTMVGRGTRGYWAVDTSTNAVVFLKDTWRNRSVLEVEGETLRRLGDLGVRHVPSLVWHGDIPSHFPEEQRRLTRSDLQSTVSHQFVSFPGICQVDGLRISVSQRYHYRLVMGTVDSPLKTVRGAKELLHATYDVLTAMRDALAKDSRLHRDISVGNIVLVQEEGDVRRGYLVDWDASCRIDDAGFALEEGRAGTWQFMSMRMLDPRQIHGKQRFLDDMESLLYVVFYCALMWQPHNLSKQALTVTIASFFDEIFERHRGEMHGGASKLANALHRQYTLTLVFDSAPLDDWILTVMDYHAPLPMDGDKYKDKWSPEQLDAYWAAFLQSYTLEPDNRVEHTLDMFNYYGSLSNSTVFSVPSSPSPGPSLGKRRPRAGRGESEPLPEEPIAKRLRSRAKPFARGRVSPRPKRSKRIHEQEKSKQSAPKKPATALVPRSAGKGKRRVAASARTARK